MIKQTLFEIAVLACIVFSSGFSAVSFYVLFVEGKYNSFKRKQIHYVDEEE